MLYARVVLGLPVDGPFDYIVPQELHKSIKAGSRVLVSFGTKKAIGYVVSLSNKTKIKKLKNISELIDSEPVLDERLLLLTKRLSEYYCCSWGEMIETAVPDGIRKGRRVLGTVPSFSSELGARSSEENLRERILVHDLNGSRWEFYLEKLKETIKVGKSAVMLLPDVQAVMDAAPRILKATGKQPLVLYRNQPKELDAWVNVRGANNTVVVGTRSSVFAPLKDLGLIIIDEEENSVYKQDQVPHYHARVAALMRADIEKLNLILASSAPSLESFYLAQNKTLTLKVLPRQSEFPEVKTMDPGRIPVGAKRSRFVFTKFLEDSIYSTLSQKGKILLFLNRKGFATTSSCHNCGFTIKCERCNINLVYYFDLDLLKCHYCNFKIQPPKICPKCNSGYVKFSGTGTQKIESELHRMFPQAKIKNFDGSNDEGISEADIVVSTSAIMKHSGMKFDLIGVLALDNSLNRVEIRSSEKVFQILSGLAGLTDKRMIIETYLGAHHVFEALSQKDAQLFYNKELEQRKQLGFVPYSHMAIVKLRAKSEEKARKASQELFDILLRSGADAQVKVLSLNPGQPAKLRGNYYWNILLSSGEAEKIAGFLKLHLKKISHSGIIVTVDVDPM